MIGLIEIRINTKSLIPGCGHLCSSLCASLNASPCLARAYSSVCLCVQVCLCSPCPPPDPDVNVRLPTKNQLGPNEARTPCVQHTHTETHTHTHTHTHTLRNTFQYTSHTSTLANYDPCKLIQAYKETSRQSYTHFCVFNKFIINKQIKTNAKTFVRLMK